MRSSLRTKIKEDFFARKLLCIKSSSLHSFKERLNLHIFFSLYFCIFIVVVLYQLENWSFDGIYMLSSHLVTKSCIFVALLLLLHYSEHLRAIILRTFATQLNETEALIELHRK